MNKKLRAFGMLCALVTTILAVMYRGDVGYAGDIRYMLISMLLFMLGTAFVFDFRRIGESIDLEDFDDTEVDDSKLQTRAFGTAMSFASALILFIVYVASI